MRTLQAESAMLHRGAEFRVAWNNAVTARLDQKPLRETLGELCESRRIAWVIDRRLDPDQSVSCESITAPLSEFMPQLLEPIHADVVVVGSTVIIGPQESIRELRTLVEIQRGELHRSGTAAPRKMALGRVLEWHWVELTEPRQLVEQLAQRAKIELAGTALIPYDLWGPGDLVGMTAGEALAVVAWQYDLQLSWSESGQATLIPVQFPVHVSRLFSIPEAKREAAQMQFPALTWKVEEKSLLVSGRVEELETLDQWLRGGPKPKPRPKKGPGDWRHRTFSLRIANAPLRDVLLALQQQGVPIQWNEQDLVAAGVDMKAKIELELKNASADELLSAVCKPGKLKYKINEQGAIITPP